ncbi:two-component system, chemotaxis family, response regulator CheY [Paenibacillus macquariensis]|uniref:Two-component system, chemotaxis family, response regulator CheY n=2 Tax=Paenibacillus macquariensis TaxID=948756 RepID=A0ABY1JXR5_9BACL|nr:two-component system, chemotaxis family, response regulator CheY [Paenibacillus macquariensis]
MVEFQRIDTKQSRWLLDVTITVFIEFKTEADIERMIKIMKAKILIVDDTKFMREVLRDIFVSNGYEVVAEAGDGEEAVHLFKIHKPNLVTMDITMPEMNGISALIEIKKIDPDAIVIMCSAMAQKGLVLDAIMAGAKDFIVKPFNKDRVIETINNVLSR